MNENSDIRVRTLQKGIAAANRLAGRPQRFDKARFDKIGVLGAGMMGAGIAYSTAAAGINVVLLDRSIELAEKGKAYGAAVVAKSVARGKMVEQDGQQLLHRIVPTVDYADLEGCDLVIEAVYEDRDVKADCTRKAEAVIPETCIYATNTSTLRISMLAEASVRPRQFIGLHFSSPVERMPIIEIIVGAGTNRETLARSMDFAQALAKTPVVVNDQWGFYLSRVFGTYPDQGMLLLEMGVAPGLIEEAGTRAGMPVGPLAVMDEISLGLSKQIQDSLAGIAGEAYKLPGSRAVVQVMVDSLGRSGRKSGGGFYEYPQSGEKYLWPGLADHFPPLGVQPSVEEVTNCLLFRQSLEAARCLEEKVVMNAIDADVCAVVGWNFPAASGGPLALIDAMGTGEFVTACRHLAETYGAQFIPPQLLVDLARKGERVYR